MEAEEKTVATEALAVFRRDFAASGAAVCGGDHMCSKYFPGRVEAKVIEGLPGILFATDLSVLLCDQHWPELECVYLVGDITNPVLAQRSTLFAISPQSYEES